MIAFLDKTLRNTIFFFLQVKVLDLVFRFMVTSPHRNGFSLLGELVTAYNKEKPKRIRTYFNTQLKTLLMLTRKNLHSYQQM